MMMIIRRDVIGRGRHLCSVPTLSMGDNLHFCKSGSFKVGCDNEKSAGGVLLTFFKTDEAAFPFSLRAILTVRRVMQKEQIANRINACMIRCHAVFKSVSVERV